MTIKRLPPWVTTRAGNAEATHRMKRLLRKRGLHTVCESARCPNLGECFARHTATFMILGDACTRRCGFCAVAHDAPSPVEREEPAQIVRAVRELRLKHVVITSVTRDDLPDGGSAHFAETVRRLRREVSAVTIEVLTPDFGGRSEDIGRVVAAGPDIYNHNLETVPRLYPTVRVRGDYARSLALLAQVKGSGAGCLTKSGIMVGLGETSEEVAAVMGDLRAVGCDVVTVGQYLRPRKENLPVSEYVSPEQFEAYERMGIALGFSVVLAGPLVRSSFRADEAMAVLKRQSTL